MSDPKLPTQRQLAEEYGVSKYVISQMLKNGVDVYSRDEVKAEIMGRRSRPPAWINGAPWEQGEKNRVRRDASEMSDDELDLMGRLRTVDNYDEARTLKTQIDGMYKLRQIEIQNREYIHRDEIMNDMMRIGRGLQAAHNKCQADLPAILEGLSAAQMKGKIRDYMLKLDAQLHDEASDLYALEG